MLLGNVLQIKNVLNGIGLNQFEGIVYKGYKGILSIRIDPKIYQGQIFDRRFSFIPLRKHDNFPVNEGDKVIISIKKTE